MIVYYFCNGKSFPFSPFRFDFQCYNLFTLKMQFSDLKIYVYKKTLHMYIKTQIMFDHTSTQWFSTR